MYVINGKNFNITQVGQNKFQSDIRDPKEAQELAELLRKMDKKVTKVEKTYTTEGGRVDVLTISDNNPNSGVTDAGVSDNVYDNNSRYAFEREYSAEDALLDSWTKSTGNTIYHVIGSGPVSGDASFTLQKTNSVQYISGGMTKNATVKDKTVYGMGIEDFHNYVKENGLDRDINWKTVEEALNAPEKFSKMEMYSDYAGAMYASLEQRINNDFSGSERTEQLDILNKTFDKAVSSYLESFAEQVSGRFERFGVDIDADAVKRSVASFIENKRDSYRDYVSQNSDYAQLSESEDKWLERDMRYMADKLRSVYSPAAESDGKYSIGEIEALGYFANSQKDVGSGEFSYVGSYYNEEKIGYSLAMRYLSAESVISEFGVGKEVKDKIMAMLDSFAEKLMDSCDEHQSAMKNYSDDGHKASDYRDKYASLDRNAVYAVLNKAKEEYRKNPSDIAEVLKKTGDFAYKQYYESKADPVKGKLARYNIDTDKPGANFFHEFYDDGSGTSYISRSTQKIKMFASAVKTHDLAFMAKADNTFFFSYKTLFGEIYDALLK